MPKRSEEPVGPSPWNDPPPVFGEIPEVNPRTDRRTVLFICSLCGAAVANRRTHIEWHRNHSPQF